jgi:hypothetical protein
VRPPDRAEKRGFTNLTTRVSNEAPVSCRIVAAVVIGGQPQSRKHAVERQVRESTHRDFRRPMAGYKEPGFQDRVASASKARESALARLKAKPPMDPAIAAERAAKAAEREAAQAARSAERAQQREQERQAAEAVKAEAKAAAEAAEAAANVPEPTEAERKAARDARYAARKARKSSR